MSNAPSTSSKSRADRFLSRRIVMGVVAGGVVLAASMLLLALVAVLAGWIDPPGTGALDLGPWLALEVVGGAAASVLAGWTCRRISLRYRGPVVLAVVVFSVGLLEALEVLRMARGGAVEAPVWLILIAPVVASAGILLGGFRRPARWGVPGPRFASGRPAASWRFAVPAIVLVAAALLSALVLPGRETDSRTLVLASALTLDLTVGVPALVYLLLVRARKLPWIAVVPAIVVGYAVATFAIPERNQAFLEYMRWLIVPGELAIVSYLVLRARRVFAATSETSGDFVTRFRTTARDLLGSRVAADILATEVGILYHAFGRTKGDRYDGRSFTVHRETGYASVLIGISMVLVVETVALHLLVSQWSPPVAWILTGLSVYALIWFVGDFRAFTARPIVLTARELRLRVGLRWEARIALEDIAEVRTDFPAAERSADALTAVVLGPPNLALRLRNPLEVIGMYGIRKSVREILVHVDEFDALLAELRPGSLPR